MAVAHEELILSRLDRLDNMVKRLEEMRGCGKSAKSSGVSTPSSGTLTSDYHTSSVDLSPKSLDKHCRPISHVVKVAELKGSLLERMDSIEDRVLKLCLQIEGEIEKQREVIMVENKNKKHNKKSFKQLVQRCTTEKCTLEKPKDMTMVEKNNKKPNKKSFKQLVQRCMPGSS